MNRGVSGAVKTEFGIGWNPVSASSGLYHGADGLGSQMVTSGLEA